MMPEFQDDSQEHKLNIYEFNDKSKFHQIDLLNKATKVLLTFAFVFTYIRSFRSSMTI